MSFGVLLPTREMAMTGRFGMAPLLNFARAAERLGFDSVWAGDSLLARPRLDPVVVLSAAAAVTQRITLGTAAMTAALRHPLVGANLVTSLDHASGARLTLGVGSGFPIPESAHEFAAVGASFAGRAARLDEIVRLWRQAWRGEEGTFAGDYWQVDGIDRLPPPARLGGPPVWLAGSDTPRVLARVAQHYDGWLPFLPSAARYHEAWTRIRDLAAGLGRRDNAITPALYATVNVNPDRRRAEDELERYVQSYYGRSLATMTEIQAYGYGSAAECADWLADYVRAGARHVVLRIGSPRPERQLAEIAEVLLPAVRSLDSPSIPEVIKEGL
jgi:alkanesulfonate monooxygenase SsuD/methylene tetrahydromethanopterin reductase-like flavin-dependent oxidoreductase (luciferase family)